MSTREQRGMVHWIDHYVVSTNDIARWEQFHSVALGAKTAPTPAEVLDLGLFQTFTQGRHGGFISKSPLPPTKGLGKGLPRYAFFVNAEDMDFHASRLDSIGATRSLPVRTNADGTTGVALYWQDPDGNQFEFWAPDRMPAGAMSGCGPERVGRISHGVFESRDLERTAAFFNRYCGLEPLPANLYDASETLVLPLASGGRLIFHKVEKLEGRTTGCGLPDAHTALLVRDEDFFFNLARIWSELPEWEFDVSSGQKIENRENLPPRTVLHLSAGGRRFKALTGRGDDWFDWDTNLFHFYGGEPIDGSMAVYKGLNIGHYIAKIEGTPGGAARLLAIVQPHTSQTLSDS